MVSLAAYTVGLNDRYYRRYLEFEAYFRNQFGHHAELIRLITRRSDSRAIS